MLPYDTLYSIALERQQTLRQEAERDRLARTARAAKDTIIPSAHSAAAPPDHSGGPALRPASVVVCIQSVQVV